MGAGRRPRPPNRRLSHRPLQLVAWDGGKALIRKTIRELADELDPSIFVKIHRRKDVLPVSRRHLHVFRQM